MLSLQQRIFLTFENSENKKETVMRNFLKKYLKYIITIFIFVVVVVFFDNHNLISRIQTSCKINNIEAEIKVLGNKIKDNKQKINALKAGGENVEKFAREQYLFQKNNEEVFVIRKKEK